MSSGFSRRDQRTVDGFVPHYHHYHYHHNHHHHQERQGVPQHDHQYDGVGYEPLAVQSTGQRFGLVDDPRRACSTAAPFFFVDDDDDVARIESPRHVDVPCLSPPTTGIARRLHYDKPTLARTRYRPYLLYGYRPAPSHRVVLRDDDVVGSPGPYPQPDHGPTRPVRRPSVDARLDHPSWVGPSYERMDLPVTTHHTTDSPGSKQCVRPPARGHVGPFTSISDTSPESGSTQSSASPRAITTHTTATTPPQPKQSRYLREMDRRAILARLDQGERQSVLAKEYDVSRSTICNLFRQRDVVLARANENPLARHPKKKARTRVGRPLSQAATNPRKPTAVEVAVASGARGQRSIEPRRTTIEVTSRAIAMLRHTLCHARTSVDEFQRCRTRLMRLVIEESLACIASRWQPSLSDGMNTRSTTVGAVSMETAGRAMLDTFRELEPDAPARLLLPPTPTPASPLGWTSYDVLLLDDVVTSPRAVDAAIKTLRSRGALDKRITLVALVVAPVVVAHVEATYPHVHVVTACIDRTLSDADGADDKQDSSPQPHSTLRARFASAA